MRVKVLAPLGLVVAAALASVPPASATSGLECHNSADYGLTCIKIHGSGLRVDDVQGYFVPPQRDYLTHRRWGFSLTQYRCNPIGKTLRQCAPKKRWFTKVRRGNPPRQGNNCAIFTPYGVGVEHCEDFGVAYEDANLGDYHGFHKLPYRYHHGVWLCNELVLRKHHHWVHNGAAHGAGERGCAKVHR